MTLLAGALALVVLRKPERRLRVMVGFAALSSLTVTEIAMVLTQLALPPGLPSALLLLALYSSSATCYAMLDHAVPRAYLEIALVSLAVLAVSVGAFQRG